MGAWWARPRCLRRREASWVGGEGGQGKKDKDNQPPKSDPIPATNE